MKCSLASESDRILSWESFYSLVESAPGLSFWAPQLSLVGPQEEQGRGDEEQQQQQHSLPRGTAQRQQGHAAVPGAWQEGEGDPVEEGKN